MKQPSKSLAQNSPCSPEAEAVSLAGNSSAGNHATSMWRTPQCSLSEDLEQSLETWPKWGSMRNGGCYLRQELALPTCASVFGFSLPTPVASDATVGSVIGKNDTYYETSTGMPRKINQRGTNGSVGLGRLVQMWPTPTVNGNNNRKGVSPSSGDGLATAVKKWPTPCANDYKGAGKSGPPRDRLDYAVERGETKNNRYEVADIGGILNPSFVEWLMGWPCGYTALTEPCRKPFQPHEIDQHCLRIVWQTTLHPADAAWTEFQTLFTAKHPILAHELAQQSTKLGQTSVSQQSISKLLANLGEACYSLPFRNGNESFQQAWGNASHEVKKWVAMATLSGIWHAEWPNVSRTVITTARTDRTLRIKVLGNGQVPKVAATAWRTLTLHPADAAAIQYAGAGSYRASGGCSSHE